MSRQDQRYAQASRDAEMHEMAKLEKLALTNIAVSLERIADALTGLEKNTRPEEILKDDT